MEQYRSLFYTYIKAYGTSTEVYFKHTYIKAYGTSTEVYFKHTYIN